jgi:hypothetical protein
MSVPGPPPTPDARVRVMQIVVIAQLLGGLVFMGITLALHAQGQFNAPPGPPMLSYIMPVICVPMVAGSVLLPRLTLASRRRQPIDTAAGGEPGPGGWYGLYLTLLLLSIAPLEGATFALLIAYLMEGQPWTLILAALTLAGIVVQFPTRERVEAWVDRQ